MKQKNKSKSKPLLSIVTVVYNGGNSLEDTILSVLNQNFDNYEYIVIDGGSTDNSLDIIKKYSDNIDYWISEKDNGIYDAMNKSLNYINGVWVNFMNVGDSYVNNNVLADFFISDYNDKSVLYGNVCLKFNDIIIRRDCSPIKKDDFIFNICHQSTFVKYSELFENKFDLNYKICADLQLVYNIYRKGLNIQFVNVDVSVYDIVGFSFNNLKLFEIELNSILNRKSSMLKKIKLFLKLALIKLFPTYYLEVYKRSLLKSDKYKIV